MEMSVQTTCDIGNGWSSPGYVVMSYLLRWQTTQCRMNFLMNFLIPFQYSNEIFVVWPLHLSDLLGTMSGRV